MIPIVIVAHINRTTMAEQLASDTQAAQIFYDDGTLGCDLNHRAAWRHHANTRAHDWSVVLEDDAKPVDGFLSQLHAALDVAPSPIVSLYLGRSRPLGGWQEAIRQGITKVRATNGCWITSTHLLHCVGVAIRTNLLPSMLDWLPTIPRPIDEAISVWAQHHGHTIGYTWPSLIDHADQPTLFAHPDNQSRREPRRAWQTGTRLVWNSRQATMTSPHARRPR